MNALTEFTLWLGTATWLLTVGFREGTQAPTGVRRGLGVGAFVIGMLMWVAPFSAYASMV